MEHCTFYHLGRTWEAAILASHDEATPVRFRHAADDGTRTYDARIDREEIEESDTNGRELALRRSLESALVVDVLAGLDDGLTAEEVAERTGMPIDDARDRLHKLEAVEPVLDPLGPRRFRLAPDQP